MKIEQITYSDLTEEEKDEGLSNNGSGMEYASYIRITHNGETLYLESDAMEPEDAIFYRDLSWIAPTIRACYQIGLQSSEK